jgi:hypothetical protein
VMMIAITPSVKLFSRLVFMLRPRRCLRLFSSKTAVPAS